MLARSNGGIIDTFASVFAASCQNGNGYKAAAEADVENKAKEREEGDATKEAREDHGKGSVDDGSSGHTLNGFLPSWNGRVASASCEDCRTVS